ncbi:MAG TPA: hypothetical protein VEH84_11640 [Alphaproteobacteria bacterium]|nr:hypothetical protein [Alphaproteobacteria bacterium]
MAGDAAAPPPDPMSPALLLTGLADAEAALAVAAEKARPFVLVAPFGAGPLWLVGVEALARRSRPDVPAVFALDCGDAPGHALHALRAGVKAVICDGPAETRPALAAIAAACGAVLLDRPARLLDLRGRRDAAAALRAACDTPDG